MCVHKEIYNVIGWNKHMCIKYSYNFLSLNLLHAMKMYEYYISKLICHSF